MFVGHYGAGFVAGRLFPQVPLWAFLVAVQFLDMVWAPLVLLGVERLRIVPGITASTPLDLYYMPFSHSLVAAGLWSVAAYAVWRIGRKGRTVAAGALAIALAVGSHWVLDVIVHRPDLPLYGDAHKVGLGLWDHVGLALALEAGLLIVGAAMYAMGGAMPRPRVAALAGLMIAAHLVGFFLMPPTTPAMAAALTLATYVAVAAAAGVATRRSGVRGGSA